MSTIFSKIITREIPGVFVYEDDVCVVIMDAFPSVPGQMLVLPRQAVDYILDLEENLYQHLWAVAKKVGLAADAALAVSRTCLVVEGFEIPHTHIKVYPVPIGKTFTEVVHTAEAPSMADPSDLSLLAKAIKAQVL